MVTPEVQDFQEVQDLRVQQVRQEVREVLGPQVHLAPQDLVEAQEQLVTLVRLDPLVVQASEDQEDPQALQAHRDLEGLTVSQDPQVRT